MLPSVLTVWRASAAPALGEMGAAGAAGAAGAVEREEGEALDVGKDPVRAAWLGDGALPQLVAASATENPTEMSLRTATWSGIARSAATRACFDRASATVLVVG